MRAAVLGTGLVGTLVAKELSCSKYFSSVVAIDSSEQAVKRCVGAKVEGRVHDLGDEREIVAALKDVDVAVSALPHALSPLANRAGVTAGCHVVDLVGSRYVEKRDELDGAARAAGVLLVPGCGVAPGVASILAAQSTYLMDEVEEVGMYCGGLPVHHEPPLWHSAVYRLESMMGLYARPAATLEGDRIVELPALSGLETCEFPAPVGACEAVYSDPHSVVHTLRGKVKRIYEKTVRYSGHFAKMQVLVELGLLGGEPIAVDGVTVTPRAVTSAVLAPKLKSPSAEDITVLRVTADGTRSGKKVSIAWEMVDLYDHERAYTSMAKTTGFPAVIVAEWIAAGKIAERGFVSPEELIPGARFEAFMEELHGHGVAIEYTASA